MSRRLAMLAQVMVPGIAIFGFLAWLEVRRLVEAHRIEGPVVDQPIVIGVVLGLLSVLAPIGWRTLRRGWVRRASGWALGAWIVVLMVGFSMTHYSRYRGTVDVQPSLAHPYLVVVVACWATILVAVLAIMPVVLWLRPDGPGSTP